jgi:flagellar basal body-associated protein FliL
MRKTVLIVVGVVVIVLLAAGFILYKSGMLPFLPKPAAAAPKEYIYSVGEITVNLNEPGYKRYIKVDVSLGSTDKALETELAEYMSKVKDTINEILRSKKIEDINTAEKTDAIKNEIRDKVNSLLTKGKVTKVYFNQILIQ